MATARRRFFPLYTSLYREPWPREWKTALAMLGMLMTDRWAADRLTEEQATRARLSANDLREVTGLEPDDAVKLLRAMSACVSLGVRPLGNGFCEIEWCKFAESLMARRPLGARPMPAQCPADAPSSSASASASEEQEEDHEGEAPSVPAPWKRLASLLSHAEADERGAWIEAHGQECHDAGEAETPRAAGEGVAEHRKRVNAARRTIALKRWNVYLRGGREFRGVAERLRLSRAVEATREQIRLEHLADPPPSEEQVAASARMFNVRRIQ